MIQFLCQLSFAEQAPGYIIDVDGIKTDVTVFIPTFSNGHFHPLQFQEDPQLLVNNKLQRVNLSRVQEMGFDYQNLNFVYQKVVYIERRIATVGLKHLIHNGHIKVYQNYFHANLIGEAVDCNFFLVNEKKQGFYPTVMLHRRKIRKFLKHCPQFDALVKNKKFNRKEIPEIMAAYNATWEED